MKVFFIFIFCFFLQRACSFGGFDLTNRSLHPLISDNDNTVCNSHSSINSTDRVRSLFIYLPLFCFLRVWIRIKTATACKIPSSLRRRLVFPSAKRSSLWGKPWGSTSPRDTTVLSLNRYAPQTVCKSNVGRLWGKRLDLLSSLRPSRARTACPAALTLLRWTLTLWRNPNWSPAVLWKAWGAPSADKVPWVSLRVYSVPGLGVLANSSLCLF